MFYPVKLFLSSLYEKAFIKFYFHLDTQFQGLWRIENGLTAKDLSFSFLCVSCCGTRQLDKQEYTHGFESSKVCHVEKVYLYIAYIIWPP